MFLLFSGIHFSVFFSSAVRCVATFLRVVVVFFKYQLNSLSLIAFSNRIFIILSCMRLIANAHHDITFSPSISRPITAIEEKGMSCDVEDYFFRISEINDLTKYIYPSIHLMGVHVQKGHIFLRNMYQWILFSKFASLKFIDKLQSIISYTYSRIGTNNKSEIKCIHSSLERK